MLATIAIATAQASIDGVRLTSATIATMALLVTAPMTRDCGDAYSDSTSVSRTEAAIA